jgi:hypothetical protein
LQAARRLRPIVMTSLAFILGVVPLAIATGASSASQQAIGTGVIGGMITATLAVVFVPVFFVVVMKLVSKRHKPLTDTTVPCASLQAKRGALGCVASRLALGISVISRLCSPGLRCWQYDPSSAHVLPHPHHPRLSAGMTVGIAASILVPADSIITKILIGWNAGSGLT